MYINEKVLAIIGCFLSFLGMALGLIAIFSDRLVVGIVSVAFSLIVFLVVFFFYAKRYRTDDSCFEEIESVYFYNKLDFNEISSVDILAHTGSDLITPLFTQFNKYKSEFQQMTIRILLRSPNAEIDSRARSIKLTVERIRNYQRRGFTKLFLQFYENLPTFRSIICKDTSPNDQKKRSAFLSFYYFPSYDDISKRFSRALVVDEKRTGTNHLLDVSESWFNYFWGKNNTREQHIHTLILDFDDTIADSHDIQIEAWMELIETAVKEFKISRMRFNKSIREILNDREALKAKVKSIFFLKQDANLIFPEIFVGLDQELTDDLQQRRFNIRREKVKNNQNRMTLFPHFMNTIIELYKKYNLIIVSSTDEDMIINYLCSQPLPANDLKGKTNLYELFRYIFGKKEPTFDWKNMKRKSKLILKIITILGIPLERMVYVGDNNGDFSASNDIGIHFVEARLFQQELTEAINKESLIDDKGKREFFTDWDQLPQILENMERQI